MAKNKSTQTTSEVKDEQLNTGTGTEGTEQLDNTGADQQGGEQEQQQGGSDGQDGAGDQLPTQEGEVKDADTASGVRLDNSGQSGSGSEGGDAPAQDAGQGTSGVAPDAGNDAGNASGTDVSTQPAEGGSAQAPVSPDVAGDAPAPTGIVSGVAAVVADAESVKAPEPVAAPTEAAGVQSTEVDINQHVREIYEQASFHGRMVIDGFYGYVGAMKPGVPLSAEEGARHQVALWRTMNRLWKLQGEFEAVFRAVLMIVNAHRDQAFRLTHVFRFFEHAVAMEGADKTAFTHWVTALINTADPRGRAQGLRQTDLNRAFQGLTEEARHRIIGFYQQ